MALRLELRDQRRSDSAEPLVDTAWQLFAALLRLGRPAPPSELAERCAAVSTGLVEFLCRIHDSPLFLTDGGLVTVSVRAVMALVGLVSPGAAGSVPSFAIRSMGPRWICDWSGDWGFSGRKRKGAVLLPTSKRRFMFSHHATDGLEEEYDARVLSSSHNRIQWNAAGNLFKLGSSDPVSTFNLSTDRSQLQKFPVIFKHDLKMSPLPACNVRIASDTWDNIKHVQGQGDVNMNYHHAGMPDRVMFDASIIELKENISAPEACRVETIVQSSELSIVQKTLDIRKAADFPASAAVVQSCTGFLNNKQNKQEAQVDLGKRYVRKKIRNQSQNMLPKEKVSESAFDSVKEHAGTKKLPQFDSFTVEEEEGSGGYGTVYRARRKSDGKTVAIKCPHPNAHSYHVNNELKMLERFGGRSFVIRFEGSFKSGNAECFVLEHVRHDRPEVLKKEIDVLELQWYGYCMFKALASLHKLGIVHRDVKPGNFLFSRHLNKGYLIDFNLAMDLHHKHRVNSRSETNYKGGSVQSLPGRKVAFSTYTKKDEKTRHLDAIGSQVDKNNKKVVLPNNTKKGLVNVRLDGSSDFKGRQKYGSQVAEASGLTSVKDVTSTRTPSVERLREPIPCRGRKELINLVHEVMHSPNKNAPLTPVSQRKRVAAPFGKVEKMVALSTPMPLHSNGILLSGSERLKNKGERKQKSEGPCVGTKGFRAPEVLFKSFNQGCKVDVWSAGVTILHMMIGRAPFGGDPAQNIKEIAKLRGSEDLWEVAKLHDRESSFPTELLDVQFLQSMELKHWCEKNTKRPEFLEIIPDTLFDLVDKCLTVNPRLRISAEEALMHDFFAPCREILRKQRMLRQYHSSENDKQRGEES